MEQRRRLTVYTLTRDKHRRAGEALQEALAQARRIVADRAHAHEKAAADRDAAQADLDACDARILQLKSEPAFSADRMVALQRHRERCAERRDAVQADVDSAERALALARRHAEQVGRDVARNQARVDSYATHIEALRGAIAAGAEREQEEQAEESALASRPVAAAPRQR